MFYKFNKTKQARRQAGQPLEQHPVARYAPIALEHRQLFDAAAIAGVEAIERDASAHAADATRHESATDFGPGVHERVGTSQSTVARTLVVIDPSVRDWQQLAAAVDPRSEVLVLDPARDGLAQIAERMAGSSQPYAAVHVLSHGQEGALQLGTRTVDQRSLSAYSTELTTIGTHLADHGDLLLYGCDIGNSAAGASFLQAIAAATGADVAASVDATGAERLGGNWALEARTGPIESSGPFAARPSGFDRLLAPVAVAQIDATSQSVLLGEQFNVTVNFDNGGATAADTGYGPFVVVFAPANGRDPSNPSNNAGPASAREGITIEAASFLGQPLTVTSGTLTGSGGSINAAFGDGGTTPAITVPSGFQAGDRYYVIQLPFGSFTAGQPPIAVNLSGQLGGYAELGTPLPISVVGGFRFGNDAFDNPGIDAPIVGAVDSLQITPSLYRVRTSLLAPEDETATGPNFLHGVRIDVDVADGQTLSNLQLSQILQDEVSANEALRFARIGTALNGAAVPTSIGGVDLGAAPSGSSWVNVNGVLVTRAGSASVTDAGTPSLGPAPGVDADVISAPAEIATSNGGTVARTISSITGTTATNDASMVVQFYVPEFNENGPADANRVIDKTSADSSFWRVDTELSALWTPTDADDGATPVAYNSDTDAPGGFAAQIEAEALALQKRGAVVQNVGDPRATPGDVVEWQLDMQISDYFAVDDLVVTDVISDGQVFYDGQGGRPTGPGTVVPTLEFSYTDRNGVRQTQTIALTGAYSVVTQAPGASVGQPSDNPTHFDATTPSGLRQIQPVLANETRTVVTFDVRGALETLFADSDGDTMVGALFNNNAASANNAPATARITFRTRIQESYVDRPQGGGSNFNLNEGDTIENAAVADARNLDTALAPAGTREFDDSGVSLPIASNAITLDIVARNGSTDNTDGRLTRIVPGDDVTYRLRYTVPTGDADNFRLSAFLPLPTLQTTDADADGAAGPAFSAAPGAGTPSATIPGIGQFSFGASFDPALAGSIVALPVVSTDANSNGITFDFGSFNDSGLPAAQQNLPRQFDIYFTVRSNGEPFDADAILLTALSQQQGNNTPGQPIGTQDITQLRVTQPLLELWKGVVRDGEAGAHTFTPLFAADDGGPAVTEAALAALIRPAGDTNADPRAGAITSANRATLDTDSANVDRGDTVRYALVVQNSGSAADGAFDVVLRDTLPFNATSADATNIRIVRGDGSVIFDGTAGTLANIVRADGTPFAGVNDVAAALFNGGSGVQLVDGALTGAIGPGATWVGNVQSPVTDGSNIVVIAYDVKLDAGTADISNQGGASSTTSAGILNYSGREGGIDYTTALDTTDGSTDGVLSEEATITIAGAKIDKVIIGTSDASPPGAPVFSSDRNAVIGEQVSYRVTITIPEGSTDNVTLTDTLDAGLGFVAIDAVTVSPSLSITGATTVNFSPDGRIATFNFGTITNTADSNAAAETIVIDYRAVVLDSAPNQAGQTRTNLADLQFDAPASVPPGTPASRPSLLFSAPNLNIVEPQLAINVSPDNASVDAGDTVTLTVVVSNSGGLTAYDVALDTLTLPAGSTYVANSWTQTGGPLFSLDPAFDTDISDGAAPTPTLGALAPGATATFTFQLTVPASVALNDTLSVNATARYSSLPGSVVDISPVPGVAGDGERSGAGGVDDYAVSDAGSLIVDAPAPLLRIVASSESTTQPGSGAVEATGNPRTDTQVAVGEIVRYRAVVQIPESTTNDLRLRLNIPPGLQYLNDGSTTVGFVSDVGITSSALAGPGLQVSDAAYAGGTPAAPADVLTAAPSFVLPGAQISYVSGSGSDPVLALGDLSSLDGNDSDREFIVVEFNALVTNESFNQLGRVIGDGTADPGTADPAMNFNVLTNGSPTSVLTSNGVVETLLEPNVQNLGKRVVAISGNQVTYEVSFGNTGTAVAHDVTLTEAFAGATNISFDGPASVSGLPVGAVNTSTADTLAVDLASVAPGQNLTVRFTATVTDATQVVPAHDIDLRYLSASKAAATLNVGALTSNAGAAGSSTGARDGSGGVPVNEANPAHQGAPLNNHADTAASGLGTIRGVLWDDTNSPNDALDAGENRLAGESVQLVWAGSDGVFGNADDVALSTVTDSNGAYQFGALPAGLYRISAPSAIAQTIAGDADTLAPRVDASGSRTDSLIDLILPDGGAKADQNFGYVQPNDAPSVLSFPVGVNFDEDTTLAFTGADQIQFADADARSGADLLVTLTIGSGKLDFSAALPGSVTPTGVGTSTVTLTGPLTDLNTALSALTFQPAANFNGPLTLTARLDDRGNSGDADSDRLPNETVGDNLFVSQAIALTVDPVNDPPVATPESRTTDETSTRSGNVLTGTIAEAGTGVGNADTDIEVSNPATQLVVQGVAAGSVAGAGLTGDVAAVVVGTYGSLVLQGDGSYTYTPDPAKTDSIPAGQQVTDVFSYAINDQGNTGKGGPLASNNTTITITITGQSAVIIAQPDERRMGEDDPPISGNVIVPTVSAAPQIERPDTDADAGDVLTVQGVAAGNVGGVQTGGVASAVTGAYGALTLQSDGSYSYATDGRAQAVPLGTSVTDVFTYTVTDGNGSTATTTLTITIDGANDNISAFPDARVINEPIDPLAPPTVTGNAVAPSAAQLTAGDQTDVDIDGDPLSVTGAAAGNQTAGAPLVSGLGTPLSGTWGELTIAANGDYGYTPGAVSQSLRAGQVVTDVFSYSVRDPAGNTANTTITITFNGDNDAPLANPDANGIVATAVAPVIGNVIGAGAPTDVPDTDPDTNALARDSLSVTGVAAGLAAGPVAGGTGAPLAGVYGSLTLGSDGAYAYAVNANQAEVIALRGGATLTDVFTYSISDGNGGTATTTLTITITGNNEPPQGADRSFTIAEDSPQGFVAQDFGFTDPDHGDTLSAVRIDSLPLSGQLLLDGVPVTAGQVIPVDALTGLIYRPAPDANRQTLSAAPSFTFSVRDADGLFDPQPNTFDFVIDPINDPPTAPNETRTINSDAQAGRPDSRVVDIPTPVDPDTPVDQLRVIVDAVPGPADGVFLHSDGSQVQPNDVMTVTELQSLRFIPSPSATTRPVNAQGLVPAGTLMFTIEDGQGGTAPGSININVRPVAVPLPAAIPPLRPSTAPLLQTPNAPGTSNEFVSVGDGGRDVLSPREIATLDQAPTAVSLSGPYSGVTSATRGVRATDQFVLSAVNDAAGARAFDDRRYADPRLTSVDAAPVQVANTATQLDRPIDPTPNASGKRTAQKGRAQTDDCAAPAVKPKPMAVKRSFSLDHAVPKPKAFSEQLNQEQKRFRPTVRPKVVPRDC